MKCKDTTFILNELRKLIKSYGPNPKSCASVVSAHAYIIPHSDAHQSEYLASCDERRKFISGFTGSAGTAIVTATKAALWTDGRYYSQASQELDNNWILMKEGLPDTPTQAKWLIDELPEESVVTADSKLISVENWKNLSKELSEAGLSLVSSCLNLVDKVWQENKPSRPDNPVFPLGLTFVGVSSSDKINNLRKSLKEETASAIVLTALDEIAYLFNLRGSDIEFNPVFFSYALISLTDVILFCEESKLSIEARLELTEENIKLLPYGDIENSLEKWLIENKGKMWVPNKSSYCIYDQVPQLRRICKPSPVALAKAIKNETEKKGLRASHVRDGVALCRYLCWLEKETPKGSQTEISGADALESFRKEQEHFVGLSFTTLSSVGPNAAIIHYHPSEATNRTITTEELYLVDSGGQYKDGTTDVTRTVHFGNPSQFEKECFTRVLKGHIALAVAIFPSKIKGNHLDTFARQFLWEVGLDYGHGTGHGIGMYLNVHEGPMGISRRFIADDPGIQEGMFLSNEPGYYEDGKFGIRIENIVETIRANTPHNFQASHYLTFKTITLAPIQLKLIDPSMLTSKEIEWINSYHEEVFEKVGSVLLNQNHNETYEWLKNETRPIG